MGLPVRHTTLVVRTHHHPQGRKSEEVSLEDTALPSWSQQSGVRPSQAKTTPCPLLPNFLPRVDSSPMTFLIRMSDVSPYYWPWPMPKPCNIGSEKVRPPTPSDYCPLVMSVVELKQHMVGTVTFSKQDVFQNLGSIIPEAGSQDIGIPQGDPITLPTTANARDMAVRPHRNPGGR